MNRTTCPATIADESSERPKYGIICAHVGEGARPTWVPLEEGEATARLSDGRSVDPSFLAFCSECFERPHEEVEVQIAHMEVRPVGEGA